MCIGILHRAIDSFCMFDLTFVPVDESIVLLLVEEVAIADDLVRVVTCEGLW